MNNMEFKDLFPGIRYRYKKTREEAMMLSGNQGVAGSVFEGMRRLESSMVHRYLDEFGKNPHFNIPLADIAEHAETSFNDEEKAYLIRYYVETGGLLNQTIFVGGYKSTERYPDGYQPFKVVEIRDGSGNGKKVLKEMVCLPLGDGPKARYICPVATHEELLQQGKHRLGEPEKIV